ncbi:hypothetical protein H0H92_004036 [Tricholoma furcatifolium]|nr:hypothetical protein H0H92_004036 [Tricholoma furcatifolium]
MYLPPFNYVHDTVFHHKVATANLRRLLRPSFDAAVKVTKELQLTPQHSSEWKVEAMDNTLALLYTSSQSRGLPHKITRNFGFLLLGEHQRLVPRRSTKTWESQIPTDPSKPLKPLDSQKHRKKQDFEAFVSNAWAPLGVQSECLVTNPAFFCDDTEAQYIYIEAKSLFFHAPSSACTTSYLSVSGFPFACDALTEDDPLFSQSLGDALDTDLEDSAVIIADAELMEETGLQANVEWRFTEHLDEVKPTGKEVTLEVPEACKNNL